MIIIILLLFIIMIIFVLITILASPSMSREITNESEEKRSDNGATDLIHPILRDKHDIT